MSKEQLEVHSPLGPSSADRWINCPGSVKATADLPDVTSVYAAEGTFAHLVSEIMRDEGKSAKQMVGYKQTVDGFDFELEAGDAAHVEDFVDYVQQHEYEQELVEARVNYDAWVDGGFGTLDAGGLTDGECMICDLKFGKGVQVWAEDNSQLKLYALGVYQDYGALYDIENFKLVIHQPRLGHVDEWEISIEDLLVWADEVVEPAADLALTDSAPFKAGKWCQFCKLRGTCRTRAETMQAEMLDEISDVRDPEEMTDDELGFALSLAPLMKKWCADIEDAVERLVQKGHEVIGSDGLPFKMVEGRSIRAWIDAAAAEKSMRGYKVKVGDMFTRKLISPTQCEKLLGKGHPLLKNHVHKPRGKPVLVPGSDRREEYQDATIDELKDVE
jgi:hypothetical protein